METTDLGLQMARRRYFTWTCSIVQVPDNLIRNGPSSKKFQPLDLPGGCEEADASLNTFLARIAAFPVWIPPLCLNFCSREIICTAEKQCEKKALLCRNQPRVIWHRMAVAASDLHFPLPNWNYDEKASRSGNVKILRRSQPSTESHCQQLFRRELWKQLKTSRV